MISHRVVPRQLLARDIFARLLRLDHLFRGRVLRREKEDHNCANGEQHRNVEPPGSVEVLNVFGLEEVVANAQERELVHQVLHNCA